MNVKVNIENTGLSKSEIDSVKPDAIKVLDRLWADDKDEQLWDSKLEEKMTGWVKAPMNITDDEIDKLLNIADVIKNEAQLLVVIGIGGSYLGAKAAIEALPKYEMGIEVKFLGNNLCTDYYWETIEEIKQKKTIVCIISKSGNTMEVRTAFEIIKPILAEKYGSEEDAAKRIIAITDPEDGLLREEARAKGYMSLEIPRNIGGRYSVLTAAGLLPMAVSGVDIRDLVKGSRDMANSPEWDLGATDYAIARYLLHSKGKAVEFVEFAHSRLGYLGEWIRQLYGESEGKNGLGLLPTTMTLSTDLHSMGQYLQEGRKNFMETIVAIDEPSIQIEIPDGPQKGKTVAEINDIMIKCLVNAHRQADIPIVEIHMPKLDAYNYGQLLYFLEMTCAITAVLMGVNPFNQPGVEVYKAEMRKLC